ncbi:MAG TPA: hypothetical protein VG388_09570 [Solirubrobacteraceae bacterium]|jgi:hypothetical protein|nr:hypothetical protein [Solirubrobacteraceae bacterium]
MAQTKRKRRTKHRGTAAGTIEARGRTGRPLTAEEKKKDARVQARERRLNSPPSWTSSSKRAGLAASLMFVVLLIAGQKGSFVHRLIPAIVFAVGAFALYSALGYYMDQYLYRRRMRKREEGR